MSRCAGKPSLPLRSAMVTSNGYDPEQLDDDLGDDAFVVGCGSDLTGTGTRPTSHSMLGPERATSAAPSGGRSSGRGVVVATTVSVLAVGGPPTSSTGPCSHNSATRFNRLSPAQVLASP